MSRDAIDDAVRRAAGELIDYLAGGGRLAVVKAPPGSGKTHTLIEVLADARREGQRIAVAAQTNSQADDICLRFAGDHPDVPIARFSSARLTTARGLPALVQWRRRRRRAADGAGRDRRDDGEVVAHRRRACRTTCSPSTRRGR